MVNFWILLFMLYVVKELIHDYNHAYDSFENFALLKAEVTFSLLNFAALFSIVSSIVFRIIIIIIQFYFLLKSHQ